MKALLSLLCGFLAIGFVFDGYGQYAFGETEKRPSPLIFTNDLNPGAAVEVKNTRGNITIKTWDKPSFNLVVQLSSKRLESKIKYDYSHDEKGVQEHLLLTTEISTESQDQIDYELTIPTRAKVIVMTTSGDIHVSSVDGYVGAVSDSGNVIFNDTIGEFAAAAQAGHVVISNAQGFGKAGAEGGNVNISLSKLSGDLEVQTKGHIGLILPQDVNAEVIAQALYGQPILFAAGLPIDIMFNGRLAMAGGVLGKRDAASRHSVFLKSYGGKIWLNRASR